MKLIKLAGKHRREHIISPWLSFEEAAIYCGVSKTTFQRLQQKKPCPHTAGNENNRRYHSAVIDQWWKDVKGYCHE